MRLLVDFLCRFGWGLSVALVLTPSTLVPAGFFRVNMLVVLGLATFAALLCGQVLPAYGWLLPTAASGTKSRSTASPRGSRTRANMPGRNSGGRGAAGSLEWGLSSRPRIVIVAVLVSS